VISANSTLSSRTSPNVATICSVSGSSPKNLSALGMLSATEGRFLRSNWRFTARPGKSQGIMRPGRPAHSAGLEDGGPCGGRGYRSATWIGNARAGRDIKDEKGPKRQGTQGTHETKNLQDKRRKGRGLRDANGCPFGPCRLGPLGPLGPFLTASQPRLNRTTLAANISQGYDRHKRNKFRSTQSAPLHRNCPTTCETDI